MEKSFQNWKYLISERRRKFQKTNRWLILHVICQTRKVKNKKINDKHFSSEEFKCERQEIYRVAIEVQNLKDDVKMKFADLDSDKKIDFKYYIWILYFFIYFFTSKSYFSLLNKIC